MTMFFEAARSNKFLPNMAIRTAAPRNQPTIWHTMYSGTNLQGCRPVTANVIFTAGLKSAPDRVERAKMPSAIAMAHPHAVGKMSPKHGAPAAHHSVAQPETPRRQTLRRQHPRPQP